MERSLRLLDEIVADVEQLPALRQLLAERYLPGAADRGMVLAGAWVSPPVAVPGEPHTLWLQWELADLASWWRMRAQAGSDPAVAALWREVDALCRSRRRHALMPADQPLPHPAEDGHGA
jgi:hypothetical protein